MSDPLADAISAADRKFRSDAARAQATFTSTSRLGTGFRSEVRLREHSLTVDEPHGIGGSDAGPTPIELVLAALGTCQEITYRAFATALGNNAKASTLGSLFGFVTQLGPGEASTITIGLDNATQQEERCQMHMIPP
jgi:hypothetical protein